MKKLLFLMFFTFAAIFANAQAGDKVNINDKFGFIQFSSTSECNTFIKNFIGKSHGEVRKFFSDNNFKSLGVSKFSNISSEEVVDENQAAVYPLNTDGVVGVDKTVLKIVNQADELEKWSEVLLLKAELLDENSYRTYALGEFNSETMKKVTSIFEECDGTSIPTGKRPFWGTGTVHHQLQNGCSYDCKRDYMFWIAVGPEYGCTEPVCNGHF